jgi:cell division protein FtsW (lipid II flippase)
MLPKIFPSRTGENSRIQSQLFILAAIFLGCYALILTLSPAVRQHSWQVSYLWVHWISLLLWLAGFSLIQHKICRQSIAVDPLILPIIATLTGWGVLSIFRLSIYFGIRQTIWMVLGILLIYFGLSWKNLLETLYRYKYVWITFGILFMALTLIFGTYPGGIGPQLWLGGYGLYVQPSEILKVLVIVYLSAYLSSFTAANLTNTRLLLPTLFIIALASGILVYQKDLGTASIIILVYILFLYMATQRRRLLILGALVLILAGIFGYGLFDVIQLRLSAWLDPFGNAAGSAYQIVQSLISVASGGIFGSGPGIGNPGFVPIAHSDFIFSSILEETGLIGATAIFILLMVLLHRIIKIALNARNQYQRMLASGLIVYLSLQSILIIGGNLNLLPLTGVTLPFVSYGGSSLLSSMFAVLIWLHIEPAQSTSITLEKPPLHSILVVESCLIGFLCLLWVFALRWGFIQSQQLVNRADNPRNAFADLYVARGKIVDRNNKILVQTVGNSGDYSREISSPALIQLTGYSNLTYGQSNLESSLNDYLRGLSANPSSDIFWNKLLYSQHPQGLNVRLTIDLELQNYSDAMLKGYTGAVVLMNPSNGEILALSSFPYLESQDSDLVEAIAEQADNPSLPLINRAVHGLYPPGSAIEPFLYDWQTAQGNTFTLPDERYLDCLTQEEPINTWNDVFQNGCAGAYHTLAKWVPVSSWKEILNAYHLLNVPNFPLTQAELPEFTPDENLTYLTTDELPLITPLQMAVAASTFSTEGTLAAPILSYAVETPHQGWVVLPKDDATTIDSLSSLTSNDFLANHNQNFWVFSGKGEREEGPVIWYGSGTTQYWNGMPMMVIVLLEEDAPVLAKSIGEQILYHALQLK